MLSNIESTSCRHRLPLIFSFTLFISSTLQCYYNYDIDSTSCWHRLPLISLFTSFTSWTSQCCPIHVSKQHRVDITHLLYPCLHRSYRRHCNDTIVVRYPINIVSTSPTSIILLYLSHIVFLYDVESTSCKNYS